MNILDPSFCPKNIRCIICMPMYFHHNVRVGRMLHAPGPTLLLRRDAVARISANGSAAFIETVLPLAEFLATASYRYIVIQSPERNVSSLSEHDLVLTAYS